MLGIQLSIEMVPQKQNNLRLTRPLYTGLDSMTWFFSSFCDRGRLRCHVLPIRAAVVAGVLCLAFTGFPSITRASIGANGFHRPPLEATGATGTQVVLKWQARSPSDDGQWRVYRSTDGETFTLAVTIEVAEGIQDYRFSDLRLRAQQPSQVYQLRYLGVDGRESIVAIARCTDSGIEDASVTPSSHNNHTVDLVHPTSMRPMIDEPLGATYESENRSWRSDPEFPPPRAA